MSRPKSADVMCYSAHGMRLLGTPKVFISYRRRTIDKAQPIASELLRSSFTAYIDVRLIGPGDGFSEKLEKAVVDSDVLLVLIDDLWLKETDAEGTRLLERPNDWVRREIELALREQKHIVPVLIDGARLPKAKELPASMSAMVDRQYFSIRADTLEQDCEILGAALWPVWRRRVRQGARLAGGVGVLGAVLWLGPVVAGSLVSHPADKPCTRSFDSLQWRRTENNRGVVDDWPIINKFENARESGIRRVSYGYFGTKLTCTTINYAPCVEVRIEGRGQGKLAQPSDLAFGPRLGSYENVQWPSAQRYLRGYEPSGARSLYQFHLTDGFRRRRSDGVYWVGLGIDACATRRGEVDGHCIVDKASSQLTIAPASCPKCEKSGIGCLRDDD